MGAHTEFRILGSSAVLALLLFSTPCSGHAAVAPPAHPDLTGTWLLNRELSEFPKEVGFDPFVPPESANAGGGTRSRGGPGGGALPSPFAVSESEEDFARMRQMIAEVQAPPPSMTIAQDES